MSDNVVNETKARNFSFLTKNEETLDTVEDGDKVYVIPAQSGSCYWAIIKIGYLYHDQPISLNDFIDKVAELLEDRDPIKWEKFKNKNSVRVAKSGSVIEKEANSWRKRIETNIKTLTRNGGSTPYGRRLIERGHILRWEPDNTRSKSGNFVLRTDTNKPIIKKRGKSKQ